MYRGTCTERAKAEQSKCECKQGIGHGHGGLGKSRGMAIRCGYLPALPNWINVERVWGRQMTVSPPLHRKLDKARGIREGAKVESRRD